MLSAADNQRVSRTAPGTPMGRVMRRYWIPALLSQQLPGPDCDPVRLTLLNERLVAFRDSAGSVGLIAENCPHRGASLFFGRNEEQGLRCVYHGWKFSTSGACLDMPNEPAESDFRTRVRATAYPCVEVADTIWTYMGPAETMPPLPMQEWMRAASGVSFTSLHLGACNWLQLVEGGIDTSHSSFLHRTLDARNSSGTLGYRARVTAPRLEVLHTEFGYTYAGIRHLKDEARNYVRAYQFIMPFHQMRASDVMGRPLLQGHIWVPADDESTWIWSWMYAPDGLPLDSSMVETSESRAGRGADDVIPGTLRFKRNKDNDYLVDRQAQRTESFTGIQGIAAQDQAAQESMGPIYDRTKEHLGTSDLAIIATRRLLLQACADVEEGKAPLGSQLESIGARAGEMVLPEQSDWREAMQAELVARW